MIFGQYMLDPETYDDYLILQEIPPASPPEWRYHDLRYLDERGLLQHRRELGTQARELIEQYHAAEDEEIRETFCRRLLYLNERLRGILRELGRRDRHVVMRALYDHEFPAIFEMRRRERERRERARQQEIEELTALQWEVLEAREQERREARVITDERENEVYTRSMEEARQARAQDRQEERENNPLVPLLPERIRNRLLGGTQEVQDRQRPNSPESSVRPSAVLISREAAQPTPTNQGLVNGATTQVQSEVTIKPSLI
jgi:hypothetical protein